MEDKIVLALLTALSFSTVLLLWLKYANNTTSLSLTTSYNSSSLHALQLPDNTSVNNGLISPCPENKTAYVLTYGNKATLCKQGFSFTTPRLKRIGNALISISNLLYVAKETSSKATLPKFSLDNLIYTNESTLHNFGYKHDVCNTITIRDNFFKSSNNYLMGVFIPNNTLLERSRLLRMYVKPRIKLIDKRSGDNALVVHIRSGDVMANNGGHRAYVQPPLAFYQKIIKENNFANIIIVCEDHNSPTIDALAKWSNISTFTSGDIQEDVATIIGASHLVMSYGTFTPMLSLLSDTLIKAYVPCVPSCFMGHYPCETLHFAAECYSFPNYTKSGEWKNTDAQRELMLSYPIENILSSKNELAKALYT